MTKKTCQAGKDVCKNLTSPCVKHDRWSQLHHTDSTPCGEGCKALCSCEMEGRLDLVCARDLSVEGTAACGHSSETWDAVQKAQEKPEPVGEGIRPDEYLSYDKLLLYFQQATAAIRSLQGQLNDMRKQSIRYHGLFGKAEAEADENGKNFADEVNLHEKALKRAEKAEAERDELQEHMGVLVEAAEKVVDKGMVYYDPPPTILPPHKTASATMPAERIYHLKEVLSNLPKAAKKRTAQIEEWKSKAVKWDAIPGQARHWCQKGSGEWFYINHGEQWCGMNDPLKSGHEAQAENNQLRPAMEHVLEYAIEEKDEELKHVAQAALKRNQ